MNIHIRWFSCVLLVTSALSAQQPAAKFLGKPDAEFKTPFTDVTSVRELRDGRVIVSDRRDRVVQRIDFTAQTALKIGREGAGPAEYALPTQLFAANGDSTLLVDVMNMRMLYIKPDALPGAVFLPELLGGKRLKGLPFAADDQGALYFYEARSTDGGRTHEDAMITRFKNGAARMDTMAVLAVVKGEMSGSSSLPGGQIRIFTNLPMAPLDVGAVAPDGRLAVVRHADYHVEWIAPNGVIEKGPPQQYVPIKVSDAEKHAFLKTLIRPGAIIVFAPNGGAKNVSASNAGSPKQVPPIPPDVRALLDDKGMTWPSTVPPFSANAASVARDGTLWVLRTRVYDDSIPTYDLFGARGQLTGRIALPKNTKLIGFGNGTVYLSRKDDDDLVHLQRYRMLPNLPSTRRERRTSGL